LEPSATASNFYISPCKRRWCGAAAPTFYAFLCKGRSAACPHPLLCLPCAKGGGSPQVSRRDCLYITCRFADYSKDSIAIPQSPLCGDCSLWNCAAGPHMGASPHFTTVPFTGRSLTHTLRLLCEPLVCPTREFVKHKKVLRPCKTGTKDCIPPRYHPNRSEDPP